jgi:hypothetical protein
MIFGCLVYIHVPKEKRTKLDPSGRKSTFVGYSESSKAYQIYIPGQIQIEVSKDVTFKEEVAFRRSRGSHMEIDSKRQEEMVPSPLHPPAVQREKVEPIDPIDPIDLVALVHVPRNIVVGHKRGRFDVSTSSRYSPRIGHVGLTSGEWPKSSIQRTEDSIC